MAFQVDGVDVTEVNYNGVSVDEVQIDGETVWTAGISIIYEIFAGVTYAGYLVNQGGSVTPQIIESPWGPLNINQLLAEKQAPNNSSFKLQDSGVTDPEDYDFYIQWPGGNELWSYAFRDPSGVTWDTSPGDTPFKLWCIANEGTTQNITISFILL